MEWGVDSRGRCPGRDFYLSLSASDKAKVEALFGRFAECGRLTSQEKFKSLGGRGGNLFEFKSFQIRFLGDFRRGHRFVVAHGVTKKRDELSRADIEAARRVLQENDESEGQ